MFSSIIWIQGSDFLVPVVTSYAGLVCHGLQSKSLLNTARAINNSVGLKNGHATLVIFTQFDSFRHHLFILSNPNIHSPDSHDRFCSTGTNFLFIFGRVFREQPFCFVRISPVCTPCRPTCERYWRRRHGSISWTSCQFVFAGTPFFTRLENRHGKIGCDRSCR